MEAHSQPVIHRLHHQMNILRSFKLNHGEPAIARRGEQIDHAAFAGGERGDLSVDMPGVESSVDAARIGCDHGFEPTFGLAAVEAMLGVWGQRVTVRFQLADQRFEVSPLLGRQHGLMIG